MCPELVERPLRLIGFTCSRLLECGAVLAGVKAKPSGWPFDRLRASLDPSSGAAQSKAVPGAGGGMGVEGSGGLALAVRCGF